MSPGKIIYLSFDQFDIKPGDTLWIYNGQDATASLIGKYNNNIIPPDTLFGGINIFVELVTNNTNVGEGFTIHYWLDYMQGVPEIQTVNALKIYPNPFSNSTIIEFPEPTTGHYTLILTDILGKKRRIINHITGSKYELKRGNLEKGLYLIEMRCVKVFRGRVLIQ